MEKRKNSKDIQVNKKIRKDEDDALLARCKECHMRLGDPSLKIFIGDPDFAVKEFIALTDPKLSIYNNGDSKHCSESPLHKITNFSVYDRNKHLCAFDSGLIEKSIELYFSGILKPIYDEDPNMEGGIATCKLGPIVEWWISGFDGGEQAIVGFSTPFAEYILMNPSEQYRPFIDEVKEKIYLSKVIIEFLCENEEAKYEDLLNKLENTMPLQGLSRFTEETLLHHSQFIINQIESFDSAADEDDNIIIVTPCIRALINLAGITVGKRQASRRAQEGNLFKPKKSTHSLATTTPIVRDSFETFFTAQLEDSTLIAPSKKYCGVCESCQSPNCGQCTFCKDMTKFGGSGKQACPKKKCLNMALQEADEDDLNDDANIEIDKSSVVSYMKKYQTKKLEVATSWIEEPLKKQSSKTWYQEVSIGDEVIKAGDFVFIAPKDPNMPLYIAKVMLLWEADFEEQMFHALWFCRGSDTVLGETCDSSEIFGIYECEDIKVNCIHSKCAVVHKTMPENWSELGGTEESLKEIIKEKDGKTFFNQKWYEAGMARFEDPPANIECSDDSGLLICISCQKQDDFEKLNAVQTKDVLKEDINIYFKEVSYKSHSYTLGECVYLNPSVYKFMTEKLKVKKKTNEKKIKENIYSEAYRKNGYVKGSNKDVPHPFTIGYIKKIYMSKKSKTANEKTVKLQVCLFYRPENTSRSPEQNYTTDMNMLYWSDDKITVNMSEVCGKCYLMYEGNLNETVVEYSNKGPNRFYFNEAYNSKKKSFEMPPSYAMSIGSIPKGEKKMIIQNELAMLTTEELYPQITCPLKSLDVFAGCGGLTEGFHQAGVAKSIWAIEKEEAAAQAFKLNFPNCTVFSEDCNLLLRLVMDGKKTYKGQKLPQKGEVELLCGGPPCQGYSGMNRFNSRQYSLFKNSLIASYLSYCDYYRPRFFVLENVRNFVAFKHSMVLKLTLSCLVRMGYQCTFGVLQAGNYGVPQTRRRVIILAAAPGEKLPFYPEALNTFNGVRSSLTVIVDDYKYESSVKCNNSAPYRTVTVRDSMSDLPFIVNGAKAEEIAYTAEPQSHFQRKMRGNGNQKIVRDHICKEMSSLVEARIKHIPLEPGSDWRDLPNKVEHLKDGKFAYKLIYTHHDKKNGYASNGALRGVCSCAEKKSCDPADHQFNTIIPWCLPHTGNRHNNWAGLYGRLDWDGFFSTTVTNPEPMGKQGRILHPEQHRVVSVRECARSQGFSDSYRFFGTILDRHRQIGNAVPPPLSAAIGLEIKKSVSAKEKLCFINGF